MIPKTRSSEWLLVLMLAACSGGNSSGGGEPIAADETSAAPILVKYCSTCHSPPSAREHSREEWAAVVERMNLHRLEGRLPALEGKDKQAVLAYLQAHAKQ